MFNRPHHQRIAKLLHAFNRPLLQEARCFFGGGTAIVLYWANIVNHWILIFYILPEKAIAYCVISSLNRGLEIYCGNRFSIGEKFGQIVMRSEPFLKWISSRSRSNFFQKVIWISRADFTQFWVYRYCPKKICMPRNDWQMQIAAMTDPC